MFPGRLSETTPADILSLITSEVAEGLDLEFKRSLPAKTGSDPWMTGGRIGDEAKDHLTREIIAFANTDGGALILGMDEDRASKRAIGPLHPIPKCKEAANTLHQSIVQRIEPRLPSFECEGIVTEADGTSGVVLMRTLPSYLAPHRNTQDRHCYVRRNDSSEPMSMGEIHDKIKRVGRSLEDIERAFAESESRFQNWIPAEFQRTHPVNGIQSIYREIEPGKTRWTGSWGLRVTAKPFAQLPATGIVQADKTFLDFPSLNGSGKQGLLQNTDLRNTRGWRQRLRSAERVFDGSHFIGLDRLSTEGQFDRFVFGTNSEDKRPEFMFFSVNELMWNISSVLSFANAIRFRASRPSQVFALEIEIVNSDPLYLVPYAGIAPHGRYLIAPFKVIFPRYELGELETFNDVITTIDQDVWNSAGLQPDWKLAIDWPKP